MESGKKTTPDKIVAANYLVGFHQQIQNLMHWFSNYLNMDTRYSYIYVSRDSEGKINDKQTNENFKKMPDDEKQSINSVLLELRYCAQNSYIQYYSLCQELKKDVNPDIKEAYESIKNNFFPNIEKIEKMVIQLNIFLLDEVIKNLLDNSQEIIREMYKDDYGTDTTDRT